MRSLIIILFTLHAIFVHAATPFDHSQWDTLLQNNVVVIEGGNATEVDYHKMSRDRETLAVYLEQLSQVDRDQFNSWSSSDQLAFLINAYNGWTVELILTKYPHLQSIKELGSLFRSPWKKKFIPLLEETRSLDDIEHGLIRGSGRYNDPRIHFAVNCASIGCPALRNQAYSGQLLETQLEAATTRFLSDRSRNRIQDKKLEISSIFKWYREDFETGWRGTNSLQQFLMLYSESLGSSTTEMDSLEITFLDYDWGLNHTE